MPASAEPYGRSLARQSDAPVPDRIVCRLLTEHQFDLTIGVGTMLGLICFERRWG